MKNYIILSLLFLPIYLTACSCIGESSVATAYEYADFVALGKVLKSETFLATADEIRPYREGETFDFFEANLINKVTIKIVKKYKGKSKQKLVTIYTGLGGGDCGYPFKIGSRYIIYGDKESIYGGMDNETLYPKEQPYYWTSICHRTTPHDGEEQAKIEAL